MRFTCPTCSRSLKCDDAFVGKKTRCPGCGQKIQVPAPPTTINKTILGKLETDVEPIHDENVEGIEHVSQPSESLPTPAPPENQFDFDEPIPSSPHDAEPPSNSSNVAMIGGSVSVLVVLVAFIAGFLIFQNIRDENRREYDRLMSENRELNRIILGLTSTNDTLERFLEDDKRNNRPSTIDRAEIERTRRTIAEAEKQRRDNYKKADALWPR